MAENRFTACPPHVLPPCVGKETCCIETGRIFDSCRDRDCFENIRVELTDYGNEIIGRTDNIRARDAFVAWTYIGIDPVRFNRGFYTVNIRFYIKLTFEACLGNCRPEEFEGIAAVDKHVVLFGGESTVSVFRSDPGSYGLCPKPQPCEAEHRVPTAVVEVVDPIVLDTRILERTAGASCGCRPGDIPEPVLAHLGSPLAANDAESGRSLSVALGLFSVVRLMRPAQLLINASEYTVPDKECVVPPVEDACGIFRNMPFPVREFNPPTVPSGFIPKGTEHCKCGQPDE